MAHDRDDDKAEKRQLLELRNIVAALKLLNETTLKIASKCAKAQRASGLFFTVGLPKNKTKVSIMPLGIKISNEQEVTVTLTPKTDAGKPAQLDGVPTWEIVSGTSQVVPSADGRTADLISSDDPGDTIILVKADANMGEEVEELSDTITLSVVGSLAKNLGLAASEPRVKRETSPE